MKVGLDVDGTITEIPEFFSVLTHALLAAGHEVHVITSRPGATVAGITKEMETLGVACSQVHVPQDADRQQTMWDWKGRVAGRLGLNLMIDDQPQVLVSMPNGVQRMWLADPKHVDLDVCIEAIGKS